MNLEIPLVGVALYLLLWDKLPDWGTWFKTFLSKLPKPLQTLYDYWECAYCFGFWVGLALHATMGIWFLPTLARMPDYWGAAGAPIAWFLDALAAAFVILVLKMVIDVMKAHR